MPDPTPPTDRKGGIDISGGSVSVNRDIIGGDVSNTTNIYGDQTTDDRHREQTLQFYLDKMTELLDKGLVKSELTSDLRVLARTRTLTALRGLDPHRQLAVLRFLREVSKSGLQTSVKKTGGVFLFSMEGAFLTGLDAKSDFSHTYLLGIKFPEKSDLHGINLQDSDLTGASLLNTNLSDANLNAAIFQNAELRGSIFTNTSLIQANLRGADLADAQMSRSNLRKANLSYAKVVYADLSHSDLFLADLSNAKVWNTNLSHSNMMFARLTNTDLDESNLTSAMLIGADMAGVILTDADLTAVNLETPLSRDYALLKVDIHTIIDLRLFDFTPIKLENLMSVRSLRGAKLPGYRTWAGKPEGPYTSEDLEPYFAKPSQ